MLKSSRSASFSICGTYSARFADHRLTRNSVSAGAKMESPNRAENSLCTICIAVHAMSDDSTACVGSLELRDPNRHKFVTYLYRESSLITDAFSLRSLSMGAVGGRAYWPHSEWNISIRRRRVVKKALHSLCRFLCTANIKGYAPIRVARQRISNNANSCGCE